VHPISGRQPSRQIPIGLASWFHWRWRIGRACPGHCAAEPRIDHGRIAQSLFRAQAVLFWAFIGFAIGCVWSGAARSEPLLQACGLVIAGPFKLSSFHARTLRAGSPAPGLHVDVPRHSADWPLLGFILMVDEFRPDNGATRFVPGSHRWEDVQAGEIPDALARDCEDLPACGPAGSLLVFHGSTWHGHGTNASSQPRRSLQGAYIPRTGRAGVDFAARMEPTTRARLGPLAHYLLAL
jgi:hypothetical protein